MVFARCDRGRLSLTHSASFKDSIVDLLHVGDLLALIFLNVLDLFGALGVVSLELTDLVNVSSQTVVLSA